MNPRINSRRFNQFSIKELKKNIATKLPLIDIGESAEKHQAKKDLIDICNMLENELYHLNIQHILRMLSAFFEAFDQLLSVKCSLHVKNDLESATNCKNSLVYSCSKNLLYYINHENIACLVDMTSEEESNLMRMYEDSLVKDGISLTRQQIAHLMPSSKDYIFHVSGILCNEALIEIINDGMNILIKVLIEKILNVLKEKIDKEKGRKFLIYLFNTLEQSTTEDLVSMLAVTFIYAERFLKKNSLSTIDALHFLLGCFMHASFAIDDFSYQVGDFATILCLSKLSLCKNEIKARKELDKILILIWRSISLDPHPVENDFRGLFNDKSNADEPSKESLAGITASAKELLQKPLSTNVTKRVDEKGVTEHSPHPKRKEESVVVLPGFFMGTPATKISPCTERKVLK